MTARWKGTREGGGAADSMSGGGWESYSMRRVCRARSETQTDQMRLSGTFEGRRYHEEELCRDFSRRPGE